MKILYYKRKDQYGFGRYYPTGKSAAAIRTLTKTETLTDAHMEALKSLGLSLVEVNEPHRA